MEQYRVYDRQTLEFVDGGIICDYNVDFDFLANNSSTVTLIDETEAKKGDILAIIEGIKCLFVGCIVSVDNTKKTINFKHMKELFNDKVINIFRFTDILGYKFDAIAALKTILEYAFITTDDAKRLLPLKIIMQGTANGAVYLDDSPSMNVLDFIHQMFDSYNVVLDFDLDFEANNVVVKIFKNTTDGLVIKDNIKLSEPQFDANEMPTYNKAVLYNPSGIIVGTYYLLGDNTVTTSSTDANRVVPVSTKYIEFDSVKAAEEGYTMLDVANSELQGNIYNHCILYKLSKEQNLVKPFDFKVGDKVTIIYEERAYDSIFTGLKFTKDSPYITCIFGKTRIDFTDRLKQYINKTFRKK